jgi:hypothetical protein
MSADQATETSRRALSAMGRYHVEDVGLPIAHMLKGWRWPYLSPLVLTITHTSTPDGTYVQVEGYTDGMPFAVNWRIERQMNQFREKFVQLMSTISSTRYQATDSPGTHGARYTDVTKELERLANLFQTGMLTEEEFTAAKQALLHTPGG